MLSPHALLSQGSYYVEIAKFLNSEVRDTAISAIEAIPFLECAGVDLFVDDIENPSEVHVTEINSAAGLNVHRYPTHGEPVELCTLIAQYFDRQQKKS